MKDRQRAPSSSKPSGFKTHQNNIGDKAVLLSYLVRFDSSRLVCPRLRDTILSIEKEKKTGKKVKIRPKNVTYGRTDGRTDGRADGRTDGNTLLWSRSVATKYERYDLKKIHWQIG